MFEKSMSKAEATAKAREEEVRVKGEREEEERRKERDRKRRRMQHKRKTGKGQVKMDGVIKDLLGKIRQGKMEEQHPHPEPCCAGARVACVALLLLR